MRIQFARYETALASYEPVIPVAPVVMSGRRTSGPAAVIGCRVIARLGYVHLQSEPFGLFDEPKLP